MKRLTLLRHAKSSWDDPALRDFDRPLNARGRRAATTMGARMRELGLEFDLVLASPAVRVVETLAGVGEGLGRTLDARFEQAIYAAAPAALLGLIREVEHGVERLLLVGHNPGLHELALRLTRDDPDGLRARAEVKFPTAALATIRLDVERWNEVVPGIGMVEAFVTPRSLAG